MFRVFLFPSFAPYFYAEFKRTSPSSQWTGNAYMSDNLWYSLIGLMSEIYSSLGFHRFDASLHPPRSNWVAVPLAVFNFLIRNFPFSEHKTPLTFEEAYQRARFGNEIAGGCEFVIADPYFSEAKEERISLLKSRIIRKHAKVSHDQVRSFIEQLSDIKDLPPNMGRLDGQRCFVEHYTPQDGYFFFDSNPKDDLPESCSTFLHALASESASHYRAPAFLQEPETPATRHQAHTRLLKRAIQNSLSSVLPLKCPVCASSINLDFTVIKISESMYRLFANSYCLTNPLHRSALTINAKQSSLIAEVERTHNLSANSQMRLLLRSGSIAQACNF